MSVEQQVMYALRNAVVRQYPYSHFYVDKVFPYAFYQEILKSLPTEASYTGDEGKYFGRKFADPKSNSIFDWMLGHDFLRAVTGVFGAELRERYKGKQIQLSTDLRLVRDKKAYQIGPHTDAPWKLISLLFYLPPDNRLHDLGTSIFVPKDEGYTDSWAQHHAFDKFEKVFTAPFVPNSCLGFLRSDTSFHGVDPIERECQRDVLLYNVYDATIYDALHPNKG